MLKLPPQIKRFLTQILSFLFVVSSTLFANWLWQKYTSEIDLKQELVEEKHLIHGIICKVIEEAEYNCSPGIGDVKCPFQLTAHHELLATSLVHHLPQSTIDLAKEILRLGGLCNGGRTGRKVTPAVVKTKSQELKEALHTVISADTQL